MILIAVPTNLGYLFAMKLASDIRQHEHSYRDHFNDELIRLQLDRYPWRLTEINQNYELCPSYPKYCVVPSTITDEEISEAAKFRSCKRFPTIVWRHTNGAIIARASQPKVGCLLWRSKQDENMIQTIINACNGTLLKNCIHGETNSNRLLILHAGIHSAAIKNYAKYYTDCDVKFMNLPDIHAISRSVRMLRAINEAQCENWLSKLTSTQLLQNLSSLINAASLIVATVDKHNRPVLVHCSDGRNHASQIITLAEIMLDSFYRTINGFQILVQREWMQFGHKFDDRCGHGVDDIDLNECSLVFLQWLDCIYQLMMQNQTAFQFNETFLRELATHTYYCIHGTLLYNTDFERTTNNLETKSLSNWSLFNIQSAQFFNCSFDETRKEVLYLLESMGQIRIYSDLYLYDTQCTLAGSSDHPSSSLLTNSLHRSRTDPKLSGSLRLEPLSSTTRTDNNTNNNNNNNNDQCKSAPNFLLRLISRLRKRKIICNDKCTKDEDHSSVVERFRCSNYNERINGEHYIVHETQPLCLNCSEREKNYCDTCGERIEKDQPQKDHESQHWHATDTCFYCYKCRIPLNNRDFFPHHGELFCSNECSSQRNNPSINTKLAQKNKIHQDPSMNPASYTYTNQHVKMSQVRPKLNPQQQKLNITNSRSYKSIQFLSSSSSEDDDQEYIWKSFNYY